MMATGSVCEIVELGINNPKPKNKDFLTVGDVGWIAGSIKEVNTVSVGDTITHIDREAKEPLPGYRKMNSMVFCGLYPVEPNK